jgi:hypothetical protein
MTMGRTAPQAGASWNCQAVSPSLSTSPVKGGQVTVTMSPDCETAMFMVNGLSPYPTPEHMVNCDYVGTYLGKRVR